MLEKYVAALIVPYLNKYVENVDVAQLRIDIWNGKASLKDLILRPDAIEALLAPPDGADGDSTEQGHGGDGTAASASPPLEKKPSRIPIRLTRGVCKNAQLYIPLKRLRSEPVVLEIDEVLVTVQSLEDAQRLASSLSSNSSVEVEEVVAQHKGSRWDLVAARKQRELDAFEADRRRQREAAAALQSGEEEAVAEAGGKAQDPQAKGSGGYFSRLAELVANNIIVKVHSVHIRYEDRTHRTVLGAILGDVQLLTVDEATGAAAFIDPSSLKKMCKRLVLSGMQVYCDATTEMDANEKQGRCWLTALQSPNDWQEWYHHMRKRVRDGDLALSTVFGPVSGAVDVKVVFKSFMRTLLDTPYASVRARLDHVLARLSRDQYLTIARTVSRLVNPDKAPRATRDVRRPRVPVKGHARVWWRYAQQAVLEMVREPRRERLLSRISEVCRMDYQVLYRDVVRQTEMSVEKKRTYRFITRFMTVPDMIAGRRDVYAQLALDMQRKRKDIQSKKAETAATGHSSGANTGSVTGAQVASGAAVAQPAVQQKKGWFSWFRGGSGASPVDTAATAKTPEEEEEEMFRSLERDYGITAEEAAQAETPARTAPPATADIKGCPTARGRDASLPPTYTWVDVALDLPYAKYSIDMGKGESVALQFFHLHARAQHFNYATSVLFHSCVQNVCLSNSAPPEQSEGAALVRQLVEGVRIGRSGSTASPHIASLDGADGRGQTQTHNAPTVREIIGLDGPVARGDTDTSLTLESPRGGTDEPLLDIAAAYQPVEQPLDDTKLDLALRVQLLPLRIVMDPHTIEHVLRFFALPTGVDVSALTSSTAEAASAVGTKASHELKAAMAKAKGIYVSVDVSAPIMVLPTTLRGRRDETALAIALGRLRFTTAPLTESEKRQRVESGVDDEEALYYTSRARFGKCYMEITTLEDALRRPEKGFMLVPEVSIVADVLQLIDDTQTDHERVVVRLKVPALRVGLSLHQVYRLTHLIETWLEYASASYRTRTGTGGGDVAGGSPAALGSLNLRSRSDSLDNSLSLGESPHTSQSLRALTSVAASPLGGNVPMTVTAAPPSTQRSASPLFAVSEEPPTDTGRRSSGAPGRASGGGSTGGSTGGAAASPHATALPPQDCPVFRAELLVESLGVDVFEDDAQALMPITPSRFAITCANAELIFAQRTSCSKLLLVVQETSALDTADKSHPILHSASLRVDVGLTNGGPTAVGLLLDHAGLVLRVGTPCMEMLECVMDIVNLAMSTMDAVALIGTAPSAQPRSDNSASAARLLSPRGGEDWDGLGAEAGNARERRAGAPPPHHLHSTPPGARRPLPPLPPTSTGAGTAPRVAGLGSSGYGAASSVSTTSAAAGQSNASPRGDVRVANISLRLDGVTRLELMSRHRGEQEDFLFASATVCDVDVFLKKNSSTMELTGKIGSAEASMGEASGLLAPHRRIVRRGSHDLPHARTVSYAEGTSEGTGSTTPHQPSTPTRKDTQRPPSAFAATDGSDDRESRGTPSRQAAGASEHQTTDTPHISFTYRRNEPVAPVFGFEEGKRVLRNAAQLRYASALELELGASTVCLDLHTIMVLKAYFTTGFFSRVSRLGDRPLYNCRTLPVARESPPRLLMSIRVVVTDAVLELPLDARSNETEFFGASIGHLAVQNNLLSSEGQQSTTVSLREICLWRYGDTCVRHGLLPSPTFMEVAIRTDLDEDSEEPTRIDVRSDDISATINNADLVDLATLVRQNLSRADVDEADSAPPEEPTVRQFVGSPYPHEPAAAAAHGDGLQAGLHISVVPPAADVVSLGNTSAPSQTDTMFGLRVGKLALVLEDAPSQPLFRLGAASIAVLASTPTNQFNVLWKSLDVADLRPIAGSEDAVSHVRSGPLTEPAPLSRTSSSYSTPATTLLLCGEGHVQFANSLTTRSILMSDFGVRPSALTSVDTDAMESITSSEVMTTLGGYARQGRQTHSAVSPLGVGSRHGRHNTAPPVNPLSDDGSDGESAHDGTEEPTSAGFMPSSAPSELLSVAVLSIKFSLRRFAVSDQWLSLYDLVCNEAVVNAFTGPQTDVVPTSAAAAPPASAPLSPADAYHPSSSGFRCTVSTSSVAIPFLTGDRRVLCEARLESLLVDVASLGVGSHVTVKVQSLELVDAKSGERVLRKRTHALAGGQSLHDGGGDMADMGEMESPLLAEYGSGYGPTASLANTATGSGAGGGTGGGGGAATTNGGSSVASPQPTAMSHGDASPAAAAAGGGPLLSPLSAQTAATNHAQSHVNSGHHASPPPPLTRFTSSIQPHTTVAEGSSGGNHIHKASTANTTGGGGTSGGGDVLHFSFKGDSEAHKNRIQLQVGQLDVLFSAPFIYGLLEYFSSPDQPISKISSLGVMKEQRARVAAAAQRMADTSVISLHVLWQQPRILCVVDGMNLANWSVTGRSRALPVCLGVMKASVLVNQALGQLSVTVRAQDFSIDDVLEKAALRLGFTASGHTQKVNVELDNTVGLCHPAEVEHLLLVLRQNLLLPPTRRYYDILPLPLPAASPVETAAADVAENTDTEVSRTVGVSIRGLHVAMHDLTRMRTHTFSLANTTFTLSATGDMELIVPTISLQEHFTNRYLLYSGRAPSSSSVSPLAASAAAVTTNSKDASTAAAAVTTADKNALVMTMRKEPSSGAAFTDVVMADTVVTLVPRGVGSLANILLSITIPEDPTAAVTMTSDVVAPVPPEEAHRDGHRTGRVLVSCLTARLEGCGVRLPQGDKDIAVLHLEMASCEKKAYTDGASQLHVVLGKLVMEDLMPRQTLYKNIIEPFTDESTSEQDEPASPQPQVTHSSTENIADSEQKLFVELSVETVGEVSDTAAATPPYGTLVSCRVGHLCFTLVPDVVHGLVRLASEVASHMSESNRGRAMGYVSETANSGLQAVRQQLNTTAAGAVPSSASVGGATAATPAPALSTEIDATRFVKLDVLVHRPQLRLVSNAMSLNTVELLPGTLTVRTEQLPPGSQPRTTRLQDPAARVAAGGDDDNVGWDDAGETIDTLVEMMDGFTPRQAFRLSVHRMAATVLGDTIFKEHCRLDLQLLQGHSVKHRLPQSHLDIAAPVVALRLSQAQLDLLLDVIGMFVGGGGAATSYTGVSPSSEGLLAGGASASLAAAGAGGVGLVTNTFGSTSSVAALSSSSGGMAAHGQLNPSATATQTAATTNPSRHRGAAPASTSVPPLVARQVGGQARAPSTTSSPPGTAQSAAVAEPSNEPASLFSSAVGVARVEVDVGDAFRWTLRQITVQNQSTPDTRTAVASADANAGSRGHLMAALEELSLQHAGSKVLELANNYTAVTSESARAALDDVRDIIVVRRLRFDSHTSGTATASAGTETDITVEADVLALAVSPTSLFDARELLYLPFSSKVLHIPVDPVPVLSLTEAVTKLDRDVVLDDKHVLLTANRMRCGYELDLQRHRLILTGAPSGQLVLYAGCEVTITNGTVVLPGLYTLGSFASFAPQSALHTTSSCVIEKTAHHSGAPTPSQPASLLTSAGSNSPIYTRASSPLPAGGTTAETAAPSQAAGSPPSQQPLPPPSRTLITFHAALACLSMLSDDVTDLSTSLEAELTVKAAIDTEKGITTSRSIGIQFRQAVSGENEAHTVLPTNMAIDISGTEKLVVSVLLDSLEFCARAALLASLVETMKDFGTAFLEEMTVTRVKPTVVLEDEHDNRLAWTTEAGDCTLCGRAGVAYLGKTSDSSKGTVCYACCTGRSTLPSMEVRVEVPWIDGILIGARGDMLHLDARRLVVEVGANMDVNVELHASLFTFNNAAAVWEPCVEKMQVMVTGNVTENNYNILIKRFDYVLSPINTTQLSAVMQELSAPALMQKRARKAFRRLAAANAPSQSYKGTYMYQEEIPQELEEVRASDRARGSGVAGALGGGSGDGMEEEELLPETAAVNANLSMVSNFSMTARVAQRRGLNAFDLAQGFRRGRAERLPPLLAPGQRSASAEAVKAAQAAVEALTSSDPFPFAYVFVTNHLHTAVFFEDKLVESRGGTGRIMTSHASALVRSAATVLPPANTDEAAEGYVINLANPVLYAQGPGFFLETTVSIQRHERDPRRLKRVVHVRVFPLHASRTIICLENRMSFPLDIRTSKAATQDSVDARDATLAYRRPATIRTGERFFFDPQMTLDAPLDVVPNTTTATATADGDATARGVAGEHDVRLPQAAFSMTGSPFIPATPLGGTPMQLTWSTDKQSKDHCTVSSTVSVRQEAIRGGVPVYVLTVQPRFHIFNKLPYPVSLTFAGTSAAAVTVSGTQARQVTVGARGRAGLTRLLIQHRLHTLDGARFTLSATQSIGNAAQPEVYTTPVPFTASGFADVAGGDAGADASGHSSDTTQFLVLVSADKSRQLVVRLVVSGPRLVLTTPFLLVNHTPVQLHLIECEPTGERKKRIDGRSRSTSANVCEKTNYNVLPANMDDGIAACPAAPSKEEFFVTVQSGAFQAKCVPLHVQQRGVMLLEEVETLSASSDAADAGSKKKSKSSKKSASTAGGTDSAAAQNGNRRMLHLAYVSRLDEAGAIRVTITPRWIVLNRCHFPLVVAPSTYAGVNAQDAAAAATAAVAVEHADSVAGTPTSHQAQVDDFKQALLRVQTDDLADRRELPENTTPHTVAPHSAMPLLETPHCSLEVGFHLHVLQDVDAPLHGTPVSLETIHSEVVLAYNHSRSNRERGSGDRNDGGGSTGRDRDRFVEVSLIAQDPYTYVVLQEPETTPYLFLNRTPYHVEVFDTAPRSDGRLLARAAPGTGTELLLDPSVTTTTRITARNGVAGDVRLTSTFDLGRNMTLRERTAAQTAGTLHYAIHFGAYGQCSVELRVGKVLEPPSGGTAGTTVSSSSAAANASPSTAATGSSSGAPASSAGAATTGGGKSKGSSALSTPPRVARVHTQALPSALSVLVNLTALTVSVAMPNQDLLFAAVLDSRLHWERNGEREKTTFSVRNFQVDNQTEIEPRYDACVLALRKSENAMAFSGYVERVVVPAKRLLCFNEIKIDCAPIALRVSDLLLARMMRFSEALAAESEIQQLSTIAASVEAANASASTVVRSPDRSAVQSARLRQEVASLRHPSAADLYQRAPDQAAFLTTHVMVERFIVNPLLVRFWLTRDVAEHDFFRENVHSREAALLSMMVASCEDVQIAAPGVACVKRMSRLGVFLQWVMKCYTDGLVAQLHGVVMQYASSLPLLGAPVKLFSGIGGGAVRLFKDPIEGLATSPSAFLTGLGSGGTGFVQGLAGGGLGAFSNLTDAGSRFLSMSSGASERERHNQNTLTALARGVQGIYQKPMEGRAEAGAAGFLKGAVQGLVGVVTNPVSGMLSDVSKASATISRLVSDTYVPKTQRVHDLRTFHANGGIAPWQAVATVYQYQRLDLRKHTWSGSALLSHADGPEWYPARREAITVDGVSVPEELWTLDRHEATIDGWTFSSKYYSSYTATLTSTVRTRRKHWTALVKPLPYSAVAAFLRVNPGMAAAPVTRPHSRTASTSFAPGTSAATVVTFTPPGVLTACTVREAKAIQAQKERQLKQRYHRTMKSGFRTARARSAEIGGQEEFASRKGVRAKMRQLTAAGRHMGVKPEALRTTRLADDDEDLPLPRLTASDFQLPGAPAEGKKRHSRTPSRVGLGPDDEGNNNGDGAATATTASADGRRGRSRSARARSRTPLRTTSSSAEPLSSEQRQATRTAAVVTFHQTTPPPLEAHEEKAAVPKPAPRPASASRKTPAFVPTTASATTGNGKDVTTPVAVSPLREAPRQERHVVTIYEYERRVSLLGWGRRLLDCPAWQDTSGRETASRDEQQPPEGWLWASNWAIVGGDAKDGWECPVNGDRNMRRRCWQRVIIQK